MDVGADLAVANGLLGPEWTQIARRLEGIILGSGLAIFGNYMPKLLSPWRLADEPFEWSAFIASSVGCFRLRAEPWFSCG